MTTLWKEELTTPVGTLHVAGNSETVIALGFGEQWPELARRVAARFRVTALPEAEYSEDSSDRRSKDPAIRTETLQALHAYFEGDLDGIDQLTVEGRGTEFQQRVWAELRNIPRGMCISYAELAKRVGSPKGFRAVGSANGRNPVSLIVPCHRVIAADGGLGGYGGGLERKRWLLEHEGVEGF